ncbi:NAD(P)/FAD-dependent oxidoreductase [Calderihabitans maritimus]|uniref:FAD-dependent pyridine nucleotide-disulfide oxidoreductase n=1 Tax=Calderihabitans maritimus TaxID=1246530 RepID=A0A1Z5HRD6_9FIRM|nr:FAD-dependent oxidoreductase [Calderihabitans maritimus]GAW92008.1 FAD-dependent pyridine nucleotide-disulfide oxidoreductase [Calderihabitans maritimus]
MHYVIIGNSAAGIGAVEGIRKVDSDNPITIISDEPYHTYSRPLISYYLAGKVSKEKMIYRKKEFYNQNRVEPLLGIKATKIDVTGKRVELENGEAVSYDRLLIATGSKPFVPPVDGLDKERVFTFLKLDDVEKIKEVARPGAKAVIIGAGLIGLKAAEALGLLGVQVTVVELADRVLSAILDGEAAAIVQQHLERQGICFELNTTAQKIHGEKQVTGVTLQNGKELTCDFLIIAIGVRPNIDLVEGTPVKVDRGIIVNEKMQTNVADIYAAGDVAQGFDIVYGQQRLIPILPGAYKQGETAGLNMAGKEVTYPGGFAMNSIGFFGLPMITAGIVNPEGEGYEVITLSQPEHQNYKKIILKEDRLVGFICLNKVDRAGILTSLINDQINVGPFKEALIREDFGYIYFPESVRKSRMLSGGVA